MNIPVKLKDMKYLLIILGLAAVYVLFSYGRVVWVVMQGRNPEIKQEDKQFGTGPALRYIAAGDSTAVGEGASSVEKTYAYRLAEHFAKDHTVSYKNIAVTGATTFDVMEKQLMQIIAFEPDVVTISAGANDRTHLKSNSAIYTNLKSIIDILTDRTSAKIYITDIPNFTGAKLLPKPYIWFLESESKKLNPKLKDLETDRVKIVNIHDFGWDQYPDLQVTFAADNFHPNDEGYNNWTNAFMSRIK
jgi:acyl-CoA thioesterase I